MSTTNRTLLPFVLVLAGIYLLAGCAVIHVKSRTFDHGHAWVAERADRSIQPGSVTKEQVVNQLGAPDITLINGRLLAYTWTSSGGGVRVVPVICFKSGDDSMNETTHYLLLEFDDQERLSRKHLHDGGTIDLYADSIERAVR
jgi:outer membrane protein assembly factor BamE (lipoprotein component of BamABCDE complex)